MSHSDEIPKTERLTAARFATTQWGVVLAAGQTHSVESQQALEELCRAYWFPLYAYLRRRGHSSHDAEDLVQDFLAQFLERHALRNVNPEKGRFRSFLIACLNHFVADVSDRNRAQKRGGDARLLSLDAMQAEQLYQLEGKIELTPDELFDRQWAIAIMAQALELLRAEQAAAGKERTFALLLPFLTETAAAGAYDSAAAQLNLTRNAVAVAVSRLRERYRELVRGKVAATVDNPSEVDAELRHLFAAMRECGRNNSR